MAAAVMGGAADDHADAAEAPPETREQRAARWRADMARRQAITAGAADWQEAARRLQGAGEMEAGTLAALGLAPLPGARGRRAT